MTIDPDVKALWRAPFRAEDMGIVDATGIVAAGAVKHHAMVPFWPLRGGRLRRCERWRRTFLTIIGTETDPAEVARLLTEAWEKPCSES